MRHCKQCLCDLRVCGVMYRPAEQRFVGRTTTRWVGLLSAGPTRLRAGIRRWRTDWRRLVYRVASTRQTLNVFTIGWQAVWNTTSKHKTSQGNKRQSLLDETWMVDTYRRALSGSSCICRSLSWWGGALMFSLVWTPERWESSSKSGALYSEIELPANYRSTLAVHTCYRIHGYRGGVRRCCRIHWYWRKMTCPSSSPGTSETSGGTVTNHCIYFKCFTTPVLHG